METAFQPKNKIFSAKESAFYIWAQYTVTLCDVANDVLCKADEILATCKKCKMTFCAPTFSRKSPCNICHVVTMIQPTDTN